MALTFRDLAWVRRTTAGPRHDANGNRSEVDNSAVNLTAVDVTTDNQDRLLQYGAVTYTYTDNGEVATRGSTTFSWDAVGNLQEVDPPGAANTIEYVYDARDRRVGKIVNGSPVQGFLYGDQLNPVAELDGASNVVRRFVYGPNGNAPDYMVTIGTGSVHRIITDQLGSVVMVVDAATGSVAQEITYDSWGRVLSDTAPGFQPFGFAGGIVDEDTGWVRFGARDYRPEVGAWVAKDPLGFAAGDANLFRYVAGDPVNWIDPSGEAMDSVTTTCSRNPAMCAEAGLGAGGLAGAAQRLAAAAPGVCQAVQRGFYTAQRGLQSIGRVRFDFSRVGHIFRDASGHVNALSQGSQARFARLFEEVASNPANFRADAVNAGIITQKAAEAGVQAFTWIGRTGQVWVTVRNGVIQNAGVNGLGALL